MLQIPRPDEAHDDLVRMIGRVRARNDTIDALTMTVCDAELERAAGMMQSTPTHRGQTEAC